MQEDGGGRAYCYRCMRVASMCLCSSLDPVAARTRVHVLQHKQERKHAFGSVRLLEAGLRGVRVEVLGEEPGGGFLRPPGLPADAALIYPGEGSQPLESVTGADAPRDLIVIDATWATAHRIFRDSPWLRGFPMYRIQPTQPSRYRIREEPRPECISTLEAVVHALRVLEPDNVELERLVEAFVRMNDQQLGFTAAGAARRPRVKRPRERPRRAIPRALVEDPSKLVVACAQPGERTTRRDPARFELAQWAAVRLTEPEQALEVFVRPSVGVPSQAFLQHLGWAPSVFDGAASLSEARDAWRRFVRPDDVVVAWEPVTVRLARATGFAEEIISLKHAYASAVGGAPGTLDDVMRREGLSPTFVSGAAGRSSIRIAQAAAVAARLGAWGRDAT